jgi:hypothetical protein
MMGSMRSVCFGFFKWCFSGTGLRAWDFVLRAVCWDCLGDRVLGAGTGDGDTARRVMGDTGCEGEGGKNTLVREVVFLCEM